MSSTTSPAPARQRSFRARSRRATAMTVAVLGTVVGLAGAEHGLGEILQGSTRPDGILIRSWPDTAAFEIVDGEPALTLIPDLLVSGIATVTVSIAIVVWAVRWIGRDGNGWTLIGSSMVLLVVGGGFGPPLMGLIIGAAALRGDPASPHRRRGANRALARFWPPLLISATLGFLLLVPGTVLLSHFAGIESAGLVVGLGIVAFSSLVLALLAARAADLVGPS